MLLSLNVKTAHSGLTTKLVGRVLLELSELSSCAFSQSGNYFARVAGDEASYVRFGETKNKYFNRSLRHGTEICVLIRFGTYRFHRYPKFRYPTLYEWFTRNVEGCYAFEMFQCKHLWHLSFIKLCVNASKTTSDAASVSSAVEDSLTLISFEW